MTFSHDQNRPAESSAPRGKPAILVIGSDAAPRATVRTLRDAGFQVCDAGTAAEANELARQHRPEAANPAVARMLGYHSAEEFLFTVTDSAHQVWVDPAERAHFLKLLEQHGAVRGYECRFQRKDGSVVWRRARCSFRNHSVRTSWPKRFA